MTPVQLTGNLIIINELKHLYLQHNLHFVQIWATERPISVDNSSLSIYRSGLSTDSTHFCWVFRFYPTIFFYTVLLFTPLHLPDSFSNKLLFRWQFFTSQQCIYTFDDGIFECLWSTEGWSVLSWVEKILLLLWLKILLHLLSSVSSQSWKNKFVSELMKSPLFRGLWVSQIRDATNMMILQRKTHCCRLNNPAVCKVVSMSSTIYSNKMQNTHECGSTIIQ